MYSSNLRLKYNFPALPTLADRKATGGVGNWVAFGNHSITADATFLPADSTTAFKIHATGAGNVSNRIAIASTYLPAWVATKKYCITFWTHSDTAFNLFIVVGADAGMTFPLGAGAGWFFSYTFTGIGLPSDLSIWLSGAGNVWFTDITVSEYTDLPVLTEKGMSDPDMYEFFPPIQNNLIDGTIQEQFTSFRRKIMFFVGVIPARADRLGILYWQLDNNRQIDYLTEYQVPVSPNWHNSSQTTGEYSNTWEQNFSGARSFTFELLESKVWTPAQGFPN